VSDPLVPARVDRAALERILQRAAELQASEHDVGEGMTPDEVVKLGDEVGIPGRYLRQAMLEEQSRLPGRESKGITDRFVGPDELGAARVVRGDPEAAERALLEWMDKNELLVLQRQQPGRLSWERMTGIQAAMRRGISTFEGARARFMLSRADVVRATITPLEAGFCHVSLAAEVTGARRAVVGGAATLGAAGLVGAGVLTVLNAFWVIPLLPAVGAAGLAWVVTRSYRPIADRVQLGLERALDHVEGNAIKPASELPGRGPGLIDLLTTEVRKAIASGKLTPPTRKPRDQ
jgi:hypothetical protein